MSSPSRSPPTATETPTPGAPPSSDPRPFRCGCNNVPLRSVRGPFLIPARQGSVSDPGPPWCRAHLGCGGEKAPPRATRRAFLIPPDRGAPRRFRCGCERGPPRCCSGAILIPPPGRTCLQAAGAKRRRSGATGVRSRSACGGCAGSVWGAAGRGGRFRGRGIEKVPSGAWGGALLIPRCGVWGSGRRAGSETGGRGGAGVRL